MTPLARHPTAQALRQRAEEQLTNWPAALPPVQAEPMHLLHELQVHQIELLMQNEALQQSEALAQEALAREEALRATVEEKVEARTAELVSARLAAEAASLAKSAFLSNMSHELRTPMNGVLGMIDLSLRAATDARQIDWLTKARRSATHLLSVINDVLDISRIEASRLQLHPTIFELGGVLQLVTDLLAPQINEKALSFDVDMAPALAALPWVGDAHRLGQILLNLAGNAVKFTEHGGVRVAVRVAEDGPAEALLHFEVHDTGIGVAPEDHGRLFVAFEQADSSMSRSHGGSGLGLAICKRMVQLMDGDIGLRSVPGLGSTFWFTVRLRKSGPGERSATEAATTGALQLLQRDFTGVRVLLVEDNAVNQEVMRFLVEDAGLVVDVADDGLAALALAQDTDYALILMDLQMPRMGGIEATGRLRALPRHQHTPVIALTASVFDHDRLQCLRAGMFDHVAKPVEPHVLYTTLLRGLRAR